MANFPNYKGISGSAGGKQICRKCLYLPASSGLSLSSPGVIYVCGLLIGFGTDSIESLLKRMVRDPKEGIERERERRQTFKWRLCVEQHLHIWAVHSEKEKRTKLVFPRCN